eukprot:3112460-Amphidinium_carterae.1
MFTKSNRGVRVAAMAKVRSFLETQNSSENEYHARALALAEQLDMEQEASVQMKHVTDPDTAFKAEAIDNLAGTGSAALRHVPSIVACLDDAETDVRRCAARALHRLGPHASHEAVPHLMRLLRDDLPGCGDEGDRDPCQVLQVLQNFAVAPQREFEGQLHAALCRHVGETASRGYDSCFNLRQRLLPVPPSWDWGREEQLYCPLNSPNSQSDEKSALPIIEYLKLAERSLSLDELELLRSCEVQHLALDLRHCSGQQIPSLEATLGM